MLDDIAIFIEVVNNNSFSKTAQKLRISQATVSRAIQNLQNQLRQELIIRSNPGFILTKMGKTFYEKSTDSIVKIDNAIKYFIKHTNQAHGDLRVAISPGLASIKFDPYIHEFKTKYPNVRIKIYYENYLPDNQNFDVIITPYSPTNDKSNNGEKVYSSNLILACTKQYIFRESLPTTLEELENHKTVGVIRKIFSPQIININNPQEEINYRFKPNIISSILTKTTFLAYYNHFIAMTTEEQLNAFGMIHVLPQYNFGRINYYLIKNTYNSLIVDGFVEFFLMLLKRDIVPLFEG
jgi:DNA-binding transcriptional LysR family regulator